MTATIQEELTLLDVFKKYGVHLAQSGTWKRSTIQIFSHEGLPRILLATRAVR